MRKSSLLKVTNVGVFLVSIGSMYGIIIAYIYHRNSPFMQVNIPYRNPMGLVEFPFFKNVDFTI